MNTSNDQNQRNDEIDLIELLVQLWHGKVWILAITVLCLCASVAVHLLSSSKFSGEFVLRGPIGIKLGTYAPINDTIQEHYASYLERETTDQYEITSEGLVQEMARELQDFEEFEVALKEHVVDIAALEDEAYIAARPALFSNLNITLATEKDPLTKVSMVWDDESKLKDILSSTLKYAEQSLNENKAAFLNSLADNLERRRRTDVEQANTSLTIAKQAIDLESRSRILFLKEQAAIARALGLEDNRLSEGAQDSQVSLELMVPTEGSASQNQNLPLSFSFESAYLRGFKSLDKEAELIAARSPEVNYLLQAEFRSLQRELAKVSNNQASKLFYQAIAESPFVANEEIFDITDDLITVRNMRRPMRTLVLGVLLGLVLGSAFVLTRGSLLNRKVNEIA